MEAIVNVCLHSITWGSTVWDSWVHSVHHLLRCPLCPSNFYLTLTEASSFSWHPTVTLQGALLCTASWLLTCASGHVSFQSDSLRRLHLVQPACAQFQAGWPLAVSLTKALSHILVQLRVSNSQKALKELYLHIPSHSHPWAKARARIHTHYHANRNRRIISKSYYLVGMALSLSSRQQCTKYSSFLSPPLASSLCSVTPMSSTKEPIRTCGLEGWPDNPWEPCSRNTSANLVFTYSNALWN